MWQKCCITYGTICKLMNPVTKEQLTSLIDEWAADWDFQKIEVSEEEYEKVSTAVKDLVNLHSHLYNYSTPERDVCLRIIEQQFYEAGSSKFRVDKGKRILRKDCVLFFRKLYELTYEQ